MLRKRLAFFLFLILLFPGCRKNRQHYAYELIPVEQNGKWGYVDKYGVFIIQPKFNLAYLFADGLAVVQDQNGKMGYINTSGSYVIEPIYKYATSFSEGLAFVTPENHVPTCIDTSGNVRFQLYDAETVYFFSEGLALFRMTDKYGYINKNGEIIIEPLYEDASSFSNGLAAIAVEAGKNFSVIKWGYVDKSGKIRIVPQFDAANDFREGKAFVQENHNKKWGVIDTRGSFSIPTQFDDATHFNDEFAAIKLGDSWGFINSEGKIVINPLYRNVLPFYHGMAAVSTDRLKWSYIHKNGTFVNEQIYEATSGYFGQQAFIVQNDKIGLIDKNGAVIVQPQFTNAFPIYMSGDKKFLNEEVFTYVINDYFDAKLVADIFFGHLSSNSFNSINDKTTYQQIQERYSDLQEKSRYGIFTEEPLELVEGVAYISNTSFEFQSPLYRMEPEYYYGKQIGEDKIPMPDAQLESTEFTIRLGYMEKAEGKESVLYDALLKSLEQRIPYPFWEEYPLERKTIVSTHRLRFTIKDNGDNITVMVDFPSLFEEE